MTGRRPMQVFLTVDTELWPAVPEWPARRLGPEKISFEQEIANDVHGQCSQGAYGLPHQIAVFNRHGLKASYFVEALCATRVGNATLAHIAGLVQSGGHQVQLHLHTEWLGDLNDTALPRQPCHYMCQLSLEQQSALIRAGLHNLRQAGVPHIQAFRAGSYGGNLDTLRALAANGIHIDSSYNPTHLVGQWNRPGLMQPELMEGVWEFPIAAFYDFPGHLRHAQLCAVSYGEMRRALLAAWDQQWPAFVIVLHSFELVCRHGPHRLPTPNWMAIRRLEQLCGLLSANKDKFQTSWFSELDLQHMPAPRQQQPLQSGLHRTLWRMGEQALSYIG